MTDSTKASEENAGFHAAMDGNPSAVYVVEVYSGVEREQLALFSTKAKASEWVALQDNVCVICPFIIDEPDFGNVRKQ